MAHHMLCSVSSSIRTTLMIRSQTTYEMIICDTTSTVTSMKYMMGNQVTF